MPPNIAHKTWVEIDAEILRSNLRLLRQATGPACETIVVVKSDAYGHGARTVATIAAEEGISRFAVASVAEGEALRQAEIDGEIILLHPLMDFEVSAALNARLTPTVSSFEMAETLNGIATRTLGVHTEVNTGLNRLGIDWASAADEIQRIAALPRLRVDGVFTHFRAAGENDTASIDVQLERFQSVIDALRGRGVEAGLIHAASSHAVARVRESHLEGIRPGIIVYTGPGPQGARMENPEKRVLSPLSRMRGVMTVYSRVLMTRTVQAGEWVHYGSLYRAERDMNVAILPIGYGMGYPRSLSGRGEVIIAGHRVPIVGAIGMDMTIVGIDGLPRIKAGDVATIIGRHGAEEISVYDVARWAQTIPYEIVCRLGNALPRVIRKRESAVPTREPAKSGALPGA